MPKIRDKRLERLAIALVGAAAIGGEAIYSTIVRNDLDYRAHPVAALAGSVAPAIIGGPILYWVLGKWGRWRMLG